MLKKIVIAEDDDAIAHMVGMALGDAGFLCIRARDGQEALQITKMHQPDVLVLDVMMPRMDGRQVASKLKEDMLLSKIPILMLTALGDVDSKVAGLDAGADDYVSKPFDLRELAARIRALIRANQRERDRNGTTDLPGSQGVDEHIQKLLAGAEEMAVLQIGVYNFSKFVARARQGESVFVDALLVDSLAFIKSMANALLTELRAQGGAFLGHLGGTDFIASCEASKLEGFSKALVEGFDAQWKSWVGGEANGTEVPLRLVIGAALSEGVSSEDELGARLAAATRNARTTEGSNYVVWSE
ncbi:MAG: response regulator [Myxococcales bacterium]|nr:response regulator [Myxococcales bacterium]